MANVNYLNGYVTDVAGVKAGNSWVTVVAIQVEDGNNHNRINLAFNKRAWADKEALFADIRTALSGIPADYNLPIDAIGQGYGA